MASEARDQTAEVLRLSFVEGLSVRAIARRLSMGGGRCGAYAAENLSALEVVDRLCDEEKQSRLSHAVQRRIRDARFPEVNTIDASGKTLGQSLKTRLVVMAVERRWS